MEEETKVTTEEASVQESHDKAVQGQESKSNDKTFTQDDMNTVIQERLARERAKLEKEYTEKMNSEVKEKEYKEREKALTIKESKWKAKELLAEKGFSAEIAEILNYESDIDLETQINYVNTSIEYAVKKQVNEMLKKGSSTPKGSTNSVNTGSTYLRQAMGLRI